MGVIASALKVSQASRAIHHLDAMRISTAATMARPQTWTALMVASAHALQVGRDHRAKFLLLAKKRIATTMEPPPTRIRPTAANVIAVKTGPVVRVLYRLFATPWTIAADMV